MAGLGPRAAPKGSTTRIGLFEMRMALSALAELVLHQMGKVQLEDADVAWRVHVVQGALAGVERGESDGPASTT